MTRLRPGPLAALCLVLLAGLARAQTIEERPDLAALFTEAGTRGTIVVRVAGGDRVVVVDKARAEQPFPPSSTFKIPNTLIALQLGVVSGMDERFAYGGSPFLVRGKPFLSPACNADVTLTVALQNSCIPVFQAIAGRVGAARYRDLLAKLNYGEGEVTEANLGDFWLTGGVRISALDQSVFLDRLVRDRLAIRSDHVQALADALAQETTGEGTLYAKTGYVFTSVPEVGWYVGWIAKDDRRVVFALNLDITAPDHPRARREIAVKVLQRLGYW